MALDYESITSIKERAKNCLELLNKTVYDGLKPPSGPYAFFHHNSHSLERLQDCYRVLKRLFEGRERLNELGRQEIAAMPMDWPPGVPYPEEFLKIFIEDQEINSYMKQDIETLYMFGMILLDQLSLQAIGIAGLNLKGKHPFTELVHFFESGEPSVLNPIWEQLKERTLWLYYQMRFYRNRFVVHANRPWQRGTTRKIDGDDFNLFTPTPPGWLDDKKLDDEIRALIHLAPDNIRNAPNDYWVKERPRTLIERIFDNIGNIENREDRERVASLYGEVGGSTPTFQIIASRLFEFVELEAGLLVNIAGENLQKINLGMPAQKTTIMV